MTYARISDQAFDRLIPIELRYLSYAHWTPIDVAIRAVSLLVSSQGDNRVLDVGAGVGKLCAVGALSSPGSWTGVEQHASLVAGANALASTLAITSRTRFIHADAFSIDWSEFDAIYVYNPFEVAVGHDHDVQVARLVERLEGLRPGVRVVTLNGIGAAMPASYTPTYRERVSGMELVLWIQRGAVA